MTEEEILVSFSKSQESKGSAHQYFTVAIGTFERLGPVICKKAWSPIVWTGGVRARKNFESCHLVAPDFDDGEMSIGDAQDYLASTGLAGIIATTKSHQTDKDGSGPRDRFRLVLKANRTESIDDYEYTMRVVMENLPCDKSCKDAARFYFPCREVVTVSAGSAMQWISCPPEESEEGRWAAQEEVAENAWRDPMLIPAWIKNSMEFGVKSPGRHKELYKVSCWLSKAGWHPREIMKMLHAYHSPLLDVDKEKHGDAERCVENGAERIARDRRKFGGKEKPSGAAQG